MYNPRRIYTYLYMSYPSSYVTPPLALLGHSAL